MNTPSSLLYAAFVSTSAAAGPLATAEFEHFSYEGRDRVFEAEGNSHTYINPVVAGFFPDPSVVRVGDDYYMTHSSFAYTPGLPILHSQNLVDWALVGNALNRTEQINMEGLGISRGIFAPTLRYHDGLYYLVTTAVDSGGNFLITASDPTGEWSEPVWLPELDGIDPDIFFDTDGRVYIAHNGPPAGKPLYEGHRAIWLWEFDLETKKVLPESGRVVVDGGVDLASEPIWIEAPHLYKVGRWYYLLCAEGGTGYNHSAVVFRARSLEEEFVPYDSNPILTQRDLSPDRENPITSAGHADFVQTPSGDWWAVFLATRPYLKDHYNTGRETFLLPVSWEDEWPRVLEKGEPIPTRGRLPDEYADFAVAEPMTGNFLWKDDFDGPRLNSQWLRLRSFDSSWLSLIGGRLHLEALDQALDSRQQPAYVGRRQQHQSFSATTRVMLPESNSLSAGLAVFQNEEFHYYLGVRADDDERVTVFIERASGSPPEPFFVASGPTAGSVWIDLVMEVDGNAISFYSQLENQPRQTLVEDADATILSTATAGGFVGATVGVHARLEGL